VNDLNFIHVDFNEGNVSWCGREGIPGRAGGGPRELLGFATANAGSPHGGILASRAVLAFLFDLVSDADESALDELEELIARKRRESKV